MKIGKMPDVPRGKGREPRDDDPGYLGIAHVDCLTISLAPGCRLS